MLGSGYRVLVWGDFVGVVARVRRSSDFGGAIVARLPRAVQQPAFGVHRDTARGLRARVLGAGGGVASEGSVRLGY